MSFGAELGQGESPLVGAGGGQDLLGHVGVGAGDPGGYRAQVLAGQGGGAEVAAQVIAGFGGPEGAVLDALLGHGERERIRAADRGGRVLASLDRGPAEGGRDAADVLRVEHVHRAELGADRAGQRVDVGLGGGGDDRAGVAQDDIGQERRLVGAGRRHHQQVLLQRDAQPVPVVGAAEEDRVLARVQDPVAQREGGADPGRAAQDGQPAPPQPQADDGGEALAGVQPQVQPDPQVAGAVAGQVPGGQERPGEGRGQDEQDGQGDGVREDHRGSPLRADRTALRRAVRAAPVFRSSLGGQVGADPGDAVQGDRGGRAMPFGHQIQEPGGLGRLPRVRPPPPARAGGSGRRGRAGGAAAGGDRAFLEHPGAEPGQRGGGGQGQAEQPQDQAAEDGQRGGRVRGQGGAEVLVEGEGPGADDADQGVARQGVGDRRHGPDGQVPPARGCRDRVHEHARGDRGQVQRPGAQRAAPVQGQGDAQAGEDQRGSVRDRRLQGRD